MERCRQGISRRDSFAEQICEQLGKLRVVDLDLAGIKSLVSGAQAKANTGPTLTLPAPNGGAMQFIIEPSGVLPEALRKKYPSIAAFKVMPLLTLRLLFDSN